MVEFESPLGKHSFGEQPERKVYTVSNGDNNAQQQPGYMRRQPSMETPAAPPAGSGGGGHGFGGGIRELSIEEREELEEKRQRARTLMEKVSPEAKKRIEFLCNLGRLKDECEIDGTKFKIRSLTGKELKEILMAVSDTNALTLGVELRNHTLARAVYEIDGQTMDLVIGTDSMQARADLWDEMGDHTAEFVHSKYKELVDKSRDKFGIKSKEDAQKVADDVKKS